MMLCFCKYVQDQDCTRLLSFLQRQLRMASNIANVPIRTISCVRHMIGLS